MKNNYMIYFLEASEMIDLETIVTVELKISTVHLQATVLYA